jgi:hypothetical protein
MTEGTTGTEFKAYAEHLAHQLLVRTAERDALAEKVRRLEESLRAADAPARRVRAEAGQATSRVA